MGKTSLHHDKHTNRRLEEGKEGRRKGVGKIGKRERERERERERHDCGKERFIVK